MLRYGYNKSFILIVAGQLVSILGGAILRFALNYYILDVTNNAAIFGAVLALSSIPAIVFTPLGGAIADRFHRKRLLIIYDSASSVIVLILLLLLVFEHLTVPYIGVILALLTIISASYQPAVQASLPVLVAHDRLTTANAIVSGIGALSTALAPVLGGWLYSFLPLYNIVLFSSMFFVLAACVNLFIKIPFVKPAGGKSLVADIARDMAAGWRYLTRESRHFFHAILFAGALSLFLLPLFTVGTPIILKETMQSNNLQYGFGMCFQPLSMILGVLFTRKLETKMALRTLYKWLFAAVAAMLPIMVALTEPVLSLGYWPAFVLYFFFSSVIGAMTTIVGLFVITKIQKETPNQTLAKVMSLVSAITQSASPLGFALYGALFQRFSTRVYAAVYVACGCTLLIAFAARKVMGRVEK